MRTGLEDLLLSLAFDGEKKVHPEPQKTIDCHGSLGSLHVGKLHKSFDFVPHILQLVDFPPHNVLRTSCLTRTYLTSSTTTRTSVILVFVLLTTTTTNHFPNKDKQNEETFVSIAMAMPVAVAVQFCYYYGTSLASQPLPTTTTTRSSFSQLPLGGFLSSFHSRPQWATGQFSQSRYPSPCLGGSSTCHCTFEYGQWEGRSRGWWHVVALDATVSLALCRDAVFRHARIQSRGGESNITSPQKYYQ